VTINQIAKINEDKGDYLVLVDYGVEGLAVWSQHGTVTEALGSLASGGPGPLCLVVLVRFDVIGAQE
jgi:hypothetical protein